jgi:hypothetical protein
MRLRRGFVGLLAGIAVLALGASAQAASFSLQALVGGASFTSGNGLFSFSAFTANLTTGLDPDLTKYTVNVLDDGFELLGPIGAADGEQDDMFLTYEVEATQGKIVSATLYFNGQVAPPINGVAASISEDWFDGAGLTNPVQSAFVARTGGGLDQPTATVGFGAGYTKLRAEKDILADARVLAADQTVTPGTVAAISVVRQTYAIPEPGTALLLAAGLAGLAVSGRKRA